MLGDFIEDEDTVSPEEAASNELLKEQVQDLLGTLSDREQRIIRMRFGLDKDGKSHTLEEVGQEFAVTRERIRQIEAKALAKLRKHKDSKKLIEYQPAPHRATTNVRPHSEGPASSVARRLITKAIGRFLLCIWP